MQDYEPSSDPVPTDHSLTDNLLPEPSTPEPSAQPLPGLFSSDSSWAETPEQEFAESSETVSVAANTTLDSSEARIRALFRILTVTSLFVLVGLCILCRDRIAALMDPAPSREETAVQSTPLDDGHPDPAETLEPSDSPETASTQRNTTRESTTNRKRDHRESGETPETPEVIPATPQSVDLRFLGIRVTGSSFVFVLDASKAMGEGPDSPSALAKKEIRRSLDDLGLGNRFQILVSGEQVSAARLSEGNRLSPATRANRSEASRFLDQIPADGDHNIGGILLDALRLKPDAVLVISDVYAPTLTTEDLALVRRVAAGHVAVHAVEIGEEIEPPEETLLRTLARENKGQYFYVHGAPHRIVHRTKSRSKANASESVSRTASVEPSRPSSGKSEDSPGFGGDSVEDTVVAGNTAVTEDRTVVPGAAQGAAEESDDLVADSRPDVPDIGKISELAEDAETSGDEATVQPRPRPVKEKPRKYNIPKAQQTEIEAMVRSVYNNAGESDFFRPTLLAKPSEQLLGAIPTIINGAKAGFPPSEYLVGLFYFNGIRAASDQEKAVDCFLRGAQDDFPPAMTMLALCYLNGRGIHTDKSEGEYWCSAAAERGDPLAMLAMSRHFSDNEATSFQWLRKAAAQGLPEAMFRLGELYEKGTGVLKSEAEAVTWYRRGAEKGSEKSKEALRRLRK